MQSNSFLWDIFCQVVDNHGDLGVCWRLSQHLISLGQSVRLYIDEPSALSWMAPDPKANPSLQILPWPTGKTGAELDCAHAFLLESLTSVLSNPEPAKENYVQGAKRLSEAIQARGQELKLALEHIRGRTRD